MTSSNNVTTLFKYRKIDNYTYKSIINNEWYFSNPERLNDPFDCQVDIFKSLRKALGRADCQKPEILSYLLTIEDKLTDVSERLKLFGVCSFSLDLLNPLLWSHYADEHRGVCLMYQFPNDYIHKVKDIIGITDVIYDKNPLTKWLMMEAHKMISCNSNVAGTCIVSPDVIINELIKIVLSIKDKCWRYENEIRIIRSVCGEIEHDKNYLKQICFGLNTPDYDIKTIKSLISSFNYDVTYCQVVRSDSDFGITSKEIC